MSPDELSDELASLKKQVNDYASREDWSTTLMEMKSKFSATEESWTSIYLGPAVEALLENIKEHYDFSRIFSSLYPYTLIVQSSGMGKSRLSDEFSKTRLTVPINLRHSGSIGYPPVDDVVRDFLTQSGNQNHSYYYSCCFLVALLEHLYTILVQMCPEPRDGQFQNLTAAFRTYMTEGMSMKGHNVNRQAFYQKVVSEARMLSGSNLRNSDPSSLIYNVTNDIQNFLYNDVKYTEHDHSEPILFLSFDEVHALTHPIEGESWTHFTGLRNALFLLRNTHVWSLFLSTAPIKALPRTNRPPVTRERRFARPFTELGFDHFAKRIPDVETVGTDTALSLEEVATVEFMSHLGRPLFGSRLKTFKQQVHNDMVLYAATKLIGIDPERIKKLTEHQQLACLSQRLVLDFTSATFSVATSAKKEEQEQVEKHLRVYLSVDAAFEDVVSVVASEPILAEGACRVMASKRFFFDPPGSLKRVLEKFSINKNNREKLPVLLLLTCARDAAVIQNDSRVFSLVNFISHLFSNPEAVLNATPSTALPSDKDKTFRDIFSTARLHFNHFIRMDDSMAIGRTNLCYLLARGAGVHCPQNRRGIHGVMAYTYHDTKLMRQNTGFILWQANNGPECTDTSLSSLFDLMDPFDVGLFDKNDEKTVVPIIRIVFALASPNPTVVVSQHDTQAQIDNHRYTSYDIWCSGLTHDCLAPIDEAQEDVWNDLLRMCQPWNDNTYKGNLCRQYFGGPKEPGAAASTV